ncbi:SDR family oxidoreductase [Vibrio salinus]|uniref:SDR family oxidoreductase n=1 Tax=Vibrio salinus TaxID=2899784 RepID=UPI001E3FB27A|nr:SDR family oxidoreductase [Vibrio salinus]MCE0495203.1 SDR family oxidoreductase [Vibrio salinus]
MNRILVSCATSHIGSAVTRLLSKDHELVLTCRNTEKMAQNLSSLNTRNMVETTYLDFFNAESVDQSTFYLKQKNFTFDGLVFILPRFPVSDSVFPDDETWLQLYKNYFITPLRFLKNIINQQLLNPGCKIVMISGLSSKSALTHYSTNNCLRHAWLGQAKTMALSLAERRISVNTLSLGGVMTDAYIQKMKVKAEQQGISYDELMRNEVSNIPLKKYAAVDEVADAIVSLLGPLSNHMTGQNLLIDGGFFKGY